VRRSFAGMGDDFVDMFSSEIDLHTLKWFSF
jgi:hypothetical protein